MPKSDIQDDPRYIALEIRLAEAQNELRDLIGAWQTIERICRPKDIDDE